MSILDVVKQSLAKPVANTTNLGNEFSHVRNGGCLSFLTMKDITRVMIYRYATISANGTINIHATAPFTFKDDSQRDLRNALKTVYVSVNTDPQRSEYTDANNKVQKVINNNNIGNFSTLMRANCTFNNKVQPNVYNELRCENAIIKRALIPVSIDGVTVPNPKFPDNPLRSYMDYINTPVMTLMNEIHTNQLALKDNLISEEDFVNLNIAAYNLYAEKVLKLFEDGFLNYSFIFVNPKPNSVSFGIGMAFNINSGSNGWFNFNNLVTLSKETLGLIPTLNKNRYTIQILDSIEDLEVFGSDNIAMLGSRDVYKGEGGATRRSRSFVAMIKDYYSDTPILVSILDSYNTMNNSNARSRVDVLESYLERGITTFVVDGTLSPIVTNLGSNDGRNGNVFLELKIEDYDVYQSTNIRSSFDAEAFDDISFDSAEGNDAFIAQAPVADEAPVDVDLSSPVSVTRKSKAKEKTNTAVVESGVDHTTPYDPSLDNDMP